MMKMMKKAALVITLIICALTMTGCGKKEEKTVPYFTYEECALDVAYQLYPESTDLTVEIVEVKWDEEKSDMIISAEIYEDYVYIGYCQFGHTCQQKGLQSNWIKENS